MPSALIPPGRDLNCFPRKFQLFCGNTTLPLSAYLANNLYSSFQRTYSAFVLPNSMEDSSIQLSWKEEQDTHPREQFEIYLISNYRRCSAAFSNVGFPELVCTL